MESQKIQELAYKIHKARLEASDIGKISEEVDGGLSVIDAYQIQEEGIRYRETDYISCCLQLFAF